MNALLTGSSKKRIHRWVKLPRASHPLSFINKHKSLSHVSSSVPITHKTTEFHWEKKKKREKKERKKEKEISTRGWLRWSRQSQVTKPGKTDRRQTGCIHEGAESIPSDDQALTESVWRPRNAVQYTCVPRETPSRREWGEGEEGR